MNLNRLSRTQIETVVTWFLRVLVIFNLTCMALQPFALVALGMAIADKNISASICFTVLSVLSTALWVITIRYWGDKARGIK